MNVTEYRDDLPTPDVVGDHPVVSFPVNETGRDFVVGDVHGMFSALRELMTLVTFSPEDDRLFSVGDLVDRGPESAEAVYWLDQPWFYACRGNHEQFAIDSEDPEQLDTWVKFNGGEWWLELTAEQREEARDAFARMPMAMEVETHSGVVGIVHADVPPLLTWARFTELLRSRDRDAALYAMWSRNRISGMCTSLPVTGGVHRVYCGHTPTRHTVQIDNVYYIDTGAVYSFEGYEDARLTFIEIHPEPHTEYYVNTA